MNRCLSDRTLMMIESGGGSAAQETHLRECGFCSARYRALREDIAAISHVLREEEPPLAASEPVTSATHRWIPRTAALALILLLAWAGATMWERSNRSHVAGMTSGEGWSILDELPSNPILLTEALALELATEGGGSYDLAATVLESERPCEWYDLPGVGGTESLFGDSEFPGATPFASCIEVNQEF